MNVLVWDSGILRVYPAETADDINRIVEVIDNVIMNSRGKRHDMADKLIALKAAVQRVLYSAAVGRSCRESSLEVARHGISNFVSRQCVGTDAFQTFQFIAMETRA